jgi:glycosyltransferase involved in cell wall biosynthesis
VVVANLETPLPASLPAGSATAVFVYGTCFHRSERVADLEILVDGVPRRPSAWGMPRPDLSGTGRRSAFWGTVAVEAPARPGSVELAVRARLTGGVHEVEPLGRIEIVEREPLRASPEPDLIAICMATFEPDVALFRAQVESLRAQTHERWRCVVSDDCSSAGHFEQIVAVIGDDPRFEISRSEQRLGFYRNFERAIRMAPPGAELLALCDQDDRWLPEKLEVLRDALGGAQLVYSDQRLVDANGRVLRDTMWRGRRNNHTDLVSMLVANSITGAAALFRREVAELALPFPDTPGLPFHDHWVALVALASGDVAYVDRPLYDYVQHRGAFFGDVTHGAGTPRRGVLRGGRGAYFRGYLPRVVLAEVLLARCGEPMTGAKARALRRFIAAERSPAGFAWLAARPLRVLAGRTETLGSESELVRGIVWRRLAALPVADARLPGLLSFQQRRLRRWRARV